LYNFRKQCGEEDIFDSLEDFEAELDEDEGIEYTSSITVQNKWIDKKRDDIAEKMWKDYQNYIQKD
jgi:hypothetical protein